ncbi:MAG TPA: class I SAM-dependent methyltransferase [Puia sp.]|nr:class I SAM-dependent methyltransferase [Puia sp.]
MSSPATDSQIHPASYRDPAGFVFTAGGTLYRQVNRGYAGAYDRLMQSGLYDKLAGEGLLIPHEETTSGLACTPEAYKILHPRRVCTVSYPSEWSPTQLRDAALLTLRIQSLAMEHGMSLKDATPFNVLFDKAKPVFIDTLSFEVYDASKPWVGYRQFCECFLFPLYLHYYSGLGTHKVAMAWPEGIAAGTTARLLPWKSHWSAGAWMHVHLQARMAARGGAGDGKGFGFSQVKLMRLIGHLQSLVAGLIPEARGHSKWSNYYDETIPSTEYLRSKEQVFREYLGDMSFGDALDLGSNEGWFARIVAEKGKPVIAVDADWSCIDRLYRKGTAEILALCVDLADPTPASGFGGAERDSFTSRAASDLVIALALVHHLAIADNVPLPLIAGYLSELTRSKLIIEFVPASDSKAQVLAARKDKALLEGYDAAHFETAFARHFRLEKTDPVPGTDRTLYLMTKLQR